MRWLFKLTMTTIIGTHSRGNDGSGRPRHLAAIIETKLSNHCFPTGSVKSKNSNVKLTQHFSNKNKTQRLIILIVIKKKKKSFNQFSEWKPAQHVNRNIKSQYDAYAIYRQQEKLNSEAKPVGWRAAEKTRLRCHLAAGKPTTPHTAISRWMNALRIILPSSGRQPNCAEEEMKK